MRTLVRPLSLPRLADLAVRRTLRKPLATMLALGLVLVVVQGVFGVGNAALTSMIESTAGSLMMLGSLLFWIPVLILTSAVVYSLLAIHACHRTAALVELTVMQTLRYFFRPRVFLTLIVVFSAILVGSVMLLLPGLLAAVCFSLVVPVMVVEDRYLVDALVRSASLVWRNPEGRIRTWPVVRVIALFASFILLSALLTLALQLPPQALMQGILLREALSGGELEASSLALVNWLALPFSLVSALVTVGAYSYLFHALGLYYRDLVERREAAELEKALLALGDESPAQEPL